MHMVFILIGGAAIVASLIFTATSMGLMMKDPGLLLGAGFVLLWGVGFVYAGISSGRRMEKLRTENFEWYKAQYPGYVRGNKVKCFHGCEGRIQMRNLYRRTFHRAHVCDVCGTTLYYSPES